MKWTTHSETIKPCTETREANAKTEKEKRERERKIEYLLFKKSICTVDGKCKKQCSIPDCSEWKHRNRGEV